MTTKIYATTPDLLAHVATKLDAEGFHFDPTQPEGESAAKGFQVSWRLSPSRVTIMLLKHPFGFEHMFWNAVDEVLGEAVEA